MPALAVPDIDLNHIADTGLWRAIRTLRALGARLLGQVRALPDANQRRRDEVSRLKGDPGRPVITPTTPPPAADHAAERERRQPTPRQVPPKRQQLVIERTATLAVDPAALPPDAEVKAFEDVVGQAVVFPTDNVLFRKATWYAPAAGQTYLAPLPPGDDGQFGPGLVTLVLTRYCAGHISEAKSLARLRGIGGLISAGHLSDLLIAQREAFHAQKAAVVEAGLARSPWQHADATSTRVNGQNWAGHIRGHPRSTA